MMIACSGVSQSVSSLQSLQNELTSSVNLCTSQNSRASKFMTVRLFVIGAFSSLRKVLDFVWGEEYSFCKRKVLKKSLKFFLKEVLKAFMQQENQYFYEFGPFQLDAQKHRLLRDGEIVPLTPKAVETLLLLVLHQGKLVEREELMKTIWHGSFVEDSNLTVTVSMLRKALEKTENGEKYIETVPKLGYRFVADVREVQGGGAIIAVEKRTRAQIVIEETIQDDLTQQAIIPTHKRFGFLHPKLTRRNAVIAATLFFVITIAVIAIAFRNSNREKTSGASVKTIAILPLRHFGMEKDDQDLHLRITDALITKFGNLRSMVVRPTSSVLRYSDNKHDAIAVGKELKVDAVLDGNIQREGTQLRVTLQLINVGDGTQIWSGQFDGRADQLLMLQDRISLQLVQNLSPNLSDDERKQFAKHTPGNPDAYEAYLKGRYFWNRRSEEGFKKAIEYFNQAINKDPDYALAYTGLADCYILLSIWGAIPPGEAMPKAKEAAMKALKADNGLAEAHVSLAFIKWVYDWDLAGADAEFKQSINLNPNYVTAHHWYSYYLAAMEQHSEAIAHIKRAQEIEGPLSLSIKTDVGEIYCWARRYDNAIEQLQDVIKIEPDFAIARNILGMTYLQKGQLKEAVAELETARRLDNSPRIISSLGYAYGVSGQHEKARKIIEELKVLSKQRYISSFAIAIIYAGIGEEENALTLLEKAYDEHSDTMVILKGYPWLGSLRANPRFAKLQQRIGLIG